MSTEIRVALVYQQEAGTATLRTALANAGVHVAIECKADSLGGSALVDAAVDAIVVNLDPELEELLDDVTEALDDALQPVIYNDPAASSDLSGWDRARWLRHLSAKLKGRSDVTPPAPEGSQSIPSPVRRVAPVVVAPAPAPAPAAVSVSVSAPALAVAAFEAARSPPVAGRAEAQPLEHVSLDLGFLDFAPATEQTPANESTPAGLAGGAPLAVSEIADLDSLFDGIPSSHSASAVPPAAAADLHGNFGSDLSLGGMLLPDTIEMSIPAEIRHAGPQAAHDQAAHDQAADTADFSMDALFAESAEIDIPAAVTPAAIETGTESDFFLDALFDSDTSETTHALGSDASAGPQDDGLADLDALFRDFESSQAAPSPPAPVSSPPVVAGSMKQVEAKNAPMDWSLEPVSEPAKVVALDRPVNEWRLDAPSALQAPAPIIDRGPPGAPSTTAAKSSGAQLPPDLEASLALADLKLLDEDFKFDSPADNALLNDGDSKATPGRFDMDLGSSLSLMDDLLGDASADSSADHARSLAELDFALDLGDLEDAAAPDHLDRGTPGTSGGLSFDGGLSDLDSLFEPVTAAPVVGLALADLNRVFVLGASIGGPESIKTFLANLPQEVPAAFIIAQHMGAEFLEMMSLQLDAATALSVRCPKHGERVRHGDVLVAPVGEQLAIDEKGNVRLSAAGTGSPYNPSIDQLVHDAADRFGAHATLILFSGMGTDALEGARYLSERGGQVWAQDPASCVISSMIDAAKAQSLVRFEGTPAQLAEHVVMVLA